MKSSKCYRVITFKHTILYTIMVLWLFFSPTSFVVWVSATRPTVHKGQAETLRWKHISIGNGKSSSSIDLTLTNQHLTDTQEITIR